MNELKNQHTHMFWGLMIVAIASKFTNSEFVYVIPALFALCLECYQFFAHDKVSKWRDRVLDAPPLADWSVAHRCLQEIESEET